MKCKSVPHIAANQTTPLSMQLPQLNGKIIPVLVLAFESIYIVDYFISYFLQTEDFVLVGGEVGVDQC